MVEDLSTVATIGTLTCPLVTPAARPSVSASALKSAPACAVPLVVDTITATALAPGSDRLTANRALPALSDTVTSLIESVGKAGGASS